MRALNAYETHGGCVRSGKWCMQPPRKHMVRTEIMQGVCVALKQQFSEDSDEDFWSPIIDSHGPRSQVWALMLT